MRMPALRVLVEVLAAALYDTAPLPAPVGARVDGDPGGCGAGGPGAALRRDDLDKSAGGSARRRRLGGAGLDEVTAPSRGPGGGAALVHGIGLAGDTDAARPRAAGIGGDSESRGAAARVARRRGELDPAIYRSSGPGSGSWRDGDGHRDWSAGGCYRLSGGSQGARPAARGGGTIEGVDRDFVDARVYGGASRGEIPGVQPNITCGHPSVDIKGLGRGTGSGGGEHGLVGKKEEVGSRSAVGAEAHGERLSFSGGRHDLADAELLAKVEQHPAGGKGVVVGGGVFVIGIVGAIPSRGCTAIVDVGGRIRGGGGVAGNVLNSLPRGQVGGSVGAGRLGSGATIATHTRACLRGRRTGSKGVWPSYLM